MFSLWIINSASSRRWIGHAAQIMDSTPWVKIGNISCGRTKVLAPWVEVTHFEDKKRCATRLPFQATVVFVTVLELAIQTWQSIDVIDDGLLDLRLIDSERMELQHVSQCP